MAIITGASGELGQAVAKKLQLEDYHLALLERTSELAQAAVQKLGNNDNIRGFAANQESRDEIEAAMQAVSEWGGSPNVLVANAGYAKYSPMLDMPAKVWNRHIEVNLSGTFHVCQIAAQQMAQAQRGGAITVISSSLAVAHSDQVGGYCISKAALLPMVKAFAAELGIHRIRVNAILPGVIETSMTSQMLAAPGVRNDLLDNTPAGRIGTPQDIAQTVAFLSSDAAEWITGAELKVDGGQSIYNQPQWIKQGRSTPHQPTWSPGLGI